MSKKKDIKTKQQFILFDTEEEQIEEKVQPQELVEENTATSDEDGMFGACEIKATQPSMRFISFGSGSSGNSSYVGTDSCGVLFDAGVDMDQVFKTLAANGVSPEMVKGICLTHDHSDHIRYAYGIARKYKHLRIYCTPRVMNGILKRHNISRRIKELHEAIFKEIPFKLAGMKITAFDVPHDGSDNAGFFIEYEGMNFAIATDLGHVSERAYHYLTQANYMMLEANYDSDMLTRGRYPEYLKNRIRAANGHLDNADAARFLADNYTEDLKYVFLCHLSNDNNTPEIALEAVRNELLKKNVSVGTACNTLEDQGKKLQLMALPRYDASPWFVLHLLK